MMKRTMQSIEKAKLLNARKWYQEPMVWMVIAIPLSAVLVGSVMLTLSIRSYDGLVVDDYYKHGKEINRVLTRNEYAKSNGLKAEVRIYEDKNIEVSLSHVQGYQLPQEIGIRLLHRTRSGRDQKTQLIRYADGLFRGSFESALKGLWTIQIETEDWRILEDVALPRASFVISAS